MYAEVAGRGCMPGCSLDTGHDGPCSKLTGPRAEAIEHFKAAWAVLDAQFADARRAFLALGEQRANLERFYADECEENDRLKAELERVCQLNSEVREQLKHTPKTTIQKVEITVSSHDDPAKVARQVNESLDRDIGWVSSKQGQNTEVAETEKPAQESKALCPSVSAGIACHKKPGHAGPHEGRCDGLPIAWGGPPFGDTAPTKLTTEQIHAELKRIRFEHTWTAEHRIRLTALIDQLYEDPKPDVTPGAELRDEYPHYYRVIPGEIVDGKPVAVVDVYRVLEAFGVNHPTLQHAIKKLMAAGQRGAKDAAHDVGEAIKSCRRWQEMAQEDGRHG